MAREIEGLLDGREARIAIVVSRFNELVTRALLDGALGALRRHGSDTGAVRVCWVPGSFEIPVAAARLARSGTVDAVICLGALIRGETSHFDHLAGSVTSALQGLAVETGVPVVNGVLTCESLEQALDRAGGKSGNKGAEAAATALELASLLSQL